MQLPYIVPVSCIPYMLTHPSPTAKAFNAAEYFNTVPELVDRKYNRPTKDMLRSSLVKNDPEKLQVGRCVYCLY